MGSDIAVGLGLDQSRAPPPVDTERKRREENVQRRGGVEEGAWWGWGEVLWPEIVVVAVERVERGGGEVYLYRLNPEPSLYLRLFRKSLGSVSPECLERGLFVVIAHCYQEYGDLLPRACTYSRGSCMLMVEDMMVLRETYMIYHPNIINRDLRIFELERFVQFFKVQSCTSTEA